MNSYRVQHIAKSPNIQRHTLLQMLGLPLQHPSPSSTPIRKYSILGNNVVMEIDQKLKFEGRRLTLMPSWSMAHILAFNWNAPK
jgi:hypothetical protein